MTKRIITILCIAIVMIASVSSVTARGDFNWNPIQWLQDRLDGTSQRLQVLLDAVTVVEAAQQELSGYVAMVNQQIAGLLKDIEGLKESSVLKQDFDQVTSELRGQLSTLEVQFQEMRRSTEEIQSKITAVEVQQIHIDEDVKSINQQIAGLLKDIEGLKESSVLKQDFDQVTSELREQLSTLEVQFEKMGRSTELLQESIVEVTGLRTKLVEAIQTVNEEIGALRKYLSRLTELEMKIDKLEIALSEYDNRTRRNRTMIWLLTAAIIYVSVSQK